MTNEELKKKICDIIAPYVSAYGDDERIAEALIAAGIRDMSDIRSLADNVILSVIAHKAEVSSMEQRAKEAEHRAQVAENELKLYKLAVKIWQERYSDIRCFNFNIALKQAENELAEEGKDD